MKFKKEVFIATLFFIVGGVVSGRFYPTEKVGYSPQVAKVEASSRPSITSTPCGRDNRYIETKDVDDNKLSQEVFGDKNAFNYVRENCLWVFGSYKANLVDTTNENLILVTAGIGCGSCHGQTLLIFSNGNEIYKQELDDPKLTVVKRTGQTDALEIIEPLRSNDESFANPSWGIKTTYEWMAQSNSLYPLSQTPIKY